MFNCTSYQWLLRNVALVRQANFHSASSNYMCTQFLLRIEEFSLEYHTLVSEFFCDDAIMLFQNKKQL